MLFFSTSLSSSTLTSSVAPSTRSTVTFSEFFTFTQEREKVIKGSLLDNKPPMTTTVHIEVYLRNEETNKPYIGYAVDDNDEALLFSTFILEDCIQQFAKKSENKVIHISSEILQKRKKENLQNIYNLPEHINYKIDCLINYIEKHKKNYMGIRTIF